MEPKKKFRIHMSNPDVDCTLVEGESILDAVQKADRMHPSVGCRSGGCGVCRVQVTSGTYTTGKMSREHATEEEESRGIVLACRTYPTSDLSCDFLGRKKQENA